MTGERAGFDPKIGEVNYVESWKSIELANHSFDYNGWSCSIVDVSPDFVYIQNVQLRQLIFVSC